MALPDFVPGAVGALLCRVLGAATQFVFYMVVARKFGAEGLGLFALAFTTTVVAAAVGRFGIDQVALRRLSEHHAHGEHVAFNALLARSLALVVLISTFVAAAVMALSAPTAAHVFGKPELAPLLRVLAFAIVPLALLQVAGEALHATGRAALSALLQTALAPLLALTLLSLAIGQPDVGDAALSYTLGCIAAMTAALVLRPRPPHAAAPAAGAPSPLAPSALLAAAAPIAWVTVLSVWLGFCETLLLGLYHSADEVGRYAAALRLVLLVNFLLVAFNAVLAPRFAVLYRERKLAELSRLARRATLVMLMLSCPVFLALFLFPGTLLTLFGPEFASASVILIVLTAGQLVNLATGPVGAILLMTGHERVMRRHLLVTVMANLALALALIPPFGPMGAACSAAAGMVMLNLLSLHSARRLLAGTRASASDGR